MRFKFKSLTEAREYLESSGVIDHQVGVLRRVEMVKCPAQFPPLKLCTGFPTVPEDGQPELGSGIGFSNIDAYMAAVVEGLERNLPRDYMRHHIVSGRYEDFGGKAVDPNHFLPYADEQYTDKFYCKKYSHDLKLTWIDAWSMKDRCFKKVPAQVAGFAYEFHKNGEPFLLEQITTGFAGHLDPYAVLASSLQEVVERHSTMTTWYSKGETHLVDCSELFQSDANWARMKRYIDDHEIDVKVVYLPNVFKIPMTVCFAFNKNRDFFKPYAVGASARPSLWDSAKKSLLEMFQTMVYFSKLTGDFPKAVRKKFASPVDVVQPMEHPAYYAELGQYDSFSWIWRDAKSSISLKPSVAGIDVGSDIVGHFLQKVKDTGRDWLVIDFTPNSYRRLGFRFVRSVLSHFVPMNGMHSLQGYRFVDKLGHSHEFLNNNPHPFP